MAALTFIQNGLTEEFEQNLTENGLIATDNSLRAMSNGAGLLHWLGQAELNEEGKILINTFLNKFSELKQKEPELPDLKLLIWKPDQEGATPLHWASQSNNTLLVKTLLSEEMVSLLRSSEDMVIDNSSAVNYIDEKSETPLFYACLEGHLDVVKILVDNGADMNIQSTLNGFTALHAAAVNFHKDLVTYLIEMGANQTILDKRGKTALDLAKELDDHDLLSYFDPVQRQKAEIIKSLENKCKKYEEHIQSLESSHTTLQSEILRLEAVISEKDKRLKETEVQFIGYSEEIQSIMKEKKELSFSYEQLMNEKIQLFDEVRSLVLEKEKDKELIQSLEHKIVTLEQELHSKDLEITSLQESSNRNHHNSDMKMENYDLSTNDPRKLLEIGLYRQIRDSLQNFQTFQQITSSSINDTLRQLDLVLNKK